LQNPSFFAFLDEKQRISYIVIMEQVVKPEKKWTRKKTVSLVLFIIIFGAIIYVGWTQYQEWYQARKELIRMGFAEDKFPYRMYTQEELREKGLLPDENQ